MESDGPLSHSVSVDLKNATFLLSICLSFFLAVTNQIHFYSADFRTFLLDSKSKWAEQFLILPFAPELLSNESLSDSDKNIEFYRKAEAEVDEFLLVFSLQQARKCVLEWLKRDGSVRRNNFHGGVN